MVKKLGRARGLIGSRLKLLFLGLLLLTGSFAVPTIAAAQVSGPREPILVAQATTAPSPTINVPPAEDDMDDDPEEGVITVSQSAWIDDSNPAFIVGMPTIVPDAPPSQFAQPPEEHAPAQV